MYQVQVQLNEIHRELTTEMLNVCKMAKVAKQSGRSYSANILTEIALKLQKLLNRLEDAAIALPVQDDF